MLILWGSMFQHKKFFHFRFFLQLCSGSSFLISIDNFPSLIETIVVLPSNHIRTLTIMISFDFKDESTLLVPKVVTLIFEYLEPFSWGFVNFKVSVLTKIENIEWFIRVLNRFNCLRSLIKEPFLSFGTALWIDNSISATQVQASSTSHHRNNGKFSVSIETTFAIKGTLTFWCYSIKVFNSPSLIESIMILPYNYIRTLLISVSFNFNGETTLLVQKVLITILE